MAGARVAEAVNPRAFLLMLATTPVLTRTEDWLIAQQERFERWLDRRDSRHTYGSGPG